MSAPSQPLAFVHGTEIVHTAAPFTPSMATESRLNQVVKGAPPPELHLAPSPPTPLPLRSASSSTGSNDPHLANLPSSPPQIYLNLLILEASLRAQYLHLLSRRRLNTFFLLVLFIWNAIFVYGLFLRPREDGTGYGGSVYWVVETLEKVGLLGGILVIWLVWLTGQWERGVRWPRKWLSTTNRGMRGFNMRVVIVKRAWWREMLADLAFLLPFGLWREAGGSDWHFVLKELSGELIEENLAPAGDRIKLLLTPKSFSPDFRGNWEEYRAEYWERENARRAGLRLKVKTRRRQRAQEFGGWTWWTGLWRLSRAHSRRSHDLEKQPHGYHHGHSSKHNHLSEKDALAKASRRRPPLRSESSHSRHSSRSSTAQLTDLDGSNEKLLSDRTRRGSSTASMRKKARDKRDGGGSARNSTLNPLTSMDADATEEPSAEKTGNRRRKSEAGSRPATPGPDTRTPTTGAGIDVQQT